MLKLVYEVVYQIPVHKLLDSVLCFVGSVVCDPVLRKIVGPNFVASVHRAQLALSFDSNSLHVLVKVDLEQSLSDYLKSPLLIRLLVSHVLVDHNRSSRNVSNLGVKRNSLTLQAESVVFTLWPPAPCDLMNSILRSESSTSKS